MSAPVLPRCMRRPLLLATLVLVAASVPSPAAADDPPFYLPATLEDLAAEVESLLERSIPCVFTSTDGNGTAACHDGEVPDLIQCIAKQYPNVKDMLACAPKAALCLEFFTGTSKIRTPGTVEFPGVSKEFLVVIGGETRTYDPYGLGTFKVVYDLRYNAC